MHIRWSKDRIAEQHLEGDCQDIAKLTIEFRNSQGRDFLRVQRIESLSDGTLRVFVDTSEEKANAA
jgi:hypothetical protein